MKVLDTQSYSEKLKINPISLSDFDKLGIDQKIDFSKSFLDTFDIVRLVNQKLYMMFLKKDLMKYVKHYADSLCAKDEGIFYYKDINVGSNRVQYVSSYDDALHYEPDLFFSETKKAEWDVSMIYKHPEQYKLSLNSDTLSQNILKDIIACNNFKEYCRK